MKILATLLSVLLAACASSTPTKPASVPSPAVHDGKTVAMTAPREPQPFTDLMIRVADVGQEEPMTPAEFRSPAGARFVHMEF